MPDMEGTMFTTTILGHSVQVLPDGGIWSIAIEGPTIRKRYTRRCFDIAEAQAAAHALIHSLLKSPCECSGMTWQDHRLPRSKIRVNPRL